MKVKNLKNGKLYKVLMTGVIDATNSRAAAGQKMVIYHLDDDRGPIFAREETEFWEKFEKEPNRCCCCGTTENLHQDGWYGYRCNSVDCMVF